MNQLHAQPKPDSVTHLQEVVVENSRLDAYNVAHYVIRVDSTSLQLAAFGTAADMMRKNGFGHIRSYGLGGVTTPAFRGTGASHTGVLWNGLNLQSPLYGQVDFTHVPVSFIDDIHLQSGGSASFHGSGAIGGTVHLRSRAHFSRGLQLSASASAGSFDSYFFGGGVLWSGKKLIHSTKLFHQQSSNHFPFTNRYVNPPAEQQRVNAATWQYGLLQQNYWRITANQLAHFRLWYQNNDIQVPNPTTVNRAGEARQQDEFYRAQTGWSLRHGRSNIAYQLSFVRHNLRYQDPTIALASTSIFNSWVNNIEGEWNVSSNFSGSLGLNSTYEKGLVDEYGSTTPVRVRSSLFTAWKTSWSKKWIGVLSARQEFVDEKRAPFVPSFSVEFYPTSEIVVHLNTSKTYRVPTFNDLYWQGSGSVGNPDLQPESGWSSELGLNRTTDQFTLRTAAFSNLVNDWILWTPLARGWSPQNIKQVWARGVESTIRIQKKIGKIKTDYGLLYSYTRSTNREVYASSQQGELGKQLAFTPQHEGSLSAALSWKKTSLNIIHAYTGKQFTDGDNSSFFALKSSQTTNIWLSWKVDFRATHSVLQFETNNLLDTDYQARPGYPMPGRNFKLSLTIQLNKPVKYEN